ncbi:serine/threonine-protein kinase pim-3-like protein [Willisornis vidua]|uniref:non-specific serine/threonine protein kinase n=1 Tax=Willisornis vidua TaxID=1566151 RepID=A0ABQ9DUH6_9PASS|nr:serine/threonine-protein kinase pim-3-like protein [Willisornis vidua]
MECPECAQDLCDVLEEWGFLMEETARGLFCQVLEAVWHCSSCGVLHCDTKARNIIPDQATGTAKLINFGRGTFLKATLHTHFLGHKCCVLQCNIKLENITLDLAAGWAKLIDFGWGTFLKDTLYTQMKSR